MFTFIDPRVAELHRQDLLAASARLRLIRSVARSAPSVPAAVPVARAAAYVREALAVLASVAVVSRTGILVEE